MKIVVLTGAGISAESGLTTFRDANGLWENYRVEDVATPEAFAEDPGLVWRFYSARRINAAAARPNAAHHAIAKFAAQTGHELVLVTQNVDALHERAHTAANVPGPIAMHGTLARSRCTECGRLYWDCNAYFDAAGQPLVGASAMCRALHVSAETPLENPKRDSRNLPLSPCCGRMLRPHIVWFGEMPLEMPRIQSLLNHCDLFVTIGTSGSVYPAAGFLQVAKAAGARTVCLNKEPLPQNAWVDQFIEGNATQVVPEFFHGLHEPSES